MPLANERRGKQLRASLGKSDNNERSSPADEEQGVRREIVGGGSDRSRTGRKYGRSSVPAASARKQAEEQPKAAAAVAQEPDKADQRRPRTFGERRRVTEGKPEAIEAPKPTRVAEHSRSQTRRKVPAPVTPTATARRNDGYKLPESNDGKFFFFQINK